MRLFACTFLSPANQAFYGRQIADSIEASGGMLRGIPEDSAHITYAFLQRADDRALREAVAAVTAVGSSRKPIAIRLGAPSILFARADARLVYVSIVHGAEALAQLGSDIAGALQRRLPDLDVSGSQAPHVTLARFRKHTRRSSARAVADALRLSAVGATERADQVDEIHVVSSELTVTGPRYVSLFRMSLDHARW